MKKQYLAIAILLFLLLILPLLLILIRQRQEIRPKAVFGRINLALTPPTLTKDIGEEFTVELQITQEEVIPFEAAYPPTATPTSPPPTPTATPSASPTPPPSLSLISGADITLAFDKNILEVKDASISGTQFTDLVLKEIKNEQGKLHFAVIAKKETDQLPTGEVVPVAKITFKGKTDGTSAVTFEEYQIVGYNQQNEDVILEVEQKTEGSYTIEGEARSKVNFAIKFRGMSEEKPDLTLTRLRVTDEKETGEPKYDFEGIEVSADEDRVYRPKEWVGLFGIIPGTDFTLLVKGPKHLQGRMAKRIEIFEGEDERNNFDWTEKPLEPGDLPDPGQDFTQDGVCNAHDASLLLERIGEIDEEALKVADLNYDGIVNLNDYSLLLATLSEKYEDEE